MLFCVFLSITGVTAQMLEEVTIDLKQVQEKEIYKQYFWNSL